MNNPFGASPFGASAAAPIDWSKLMQGGGAPDLGFGGGLDASAALDATANPLTQANGLPSTPANQTQGRPDKDALMMDYLSTMGDLAPKEKELARKRSLVKELRGTKSPEMRNAGRLVVAANPLEFLGTAAHQGLGAYKEMQADEDQLAYQSAADKAFAGLRSRAGMGS